MKAVVLALVLTAAAPASAEPSIDRDARIAYLDRALAAVRGLGAGGGERLERDVYGAARARCHTEAAPPTAACAIEAARATCAATAAGGAAACLAAADVIATNLRSVDDFVDEATRARLVRSGDYHAALLAALRARYAQLAAELVLADPGGGDAAAIDRLCTQRDRVPHACAPGDLGCVPSLPWTRCAAALIWYVGGAEGGRR